MESNQDSEMHGVTLPPGGDGDHEHIIPQDKMRQEPHIYASESANGNDTDLERVCITNRIEDPAQLDTVRRTPSGLLQHRDLSYRRPTHAALVPEGKPIPPLRAVRAVANLEEGVPRRSNSRILRTLHSRPIWEEEPPLCSATSLLRTLAAIGVIFGDIGTSPLYTMSTIYCPSDCYTPQAEDVKGVLSMMIWSLVIETSIKYIIILLLNMHHGEGGIFALLLMTKANAKRHIPEGMVFFLTVVACFGSCALIADGVITPALSVLSAVGGLADPRIAQNSVNQVNESVEWVTIGLLLILYIAQPFGTGKVGQSFGPGVIIYLTAIGGIGLYNLIISGAWEVLEGWSPHYAFKIWVYGDYAGLPAFNMFSSVVLTVTGSEAIYADVGHFGRRPVQLAWFGFAFPMLVLQYTGQAAYILVNPANVSNPYFLMIPDQLYVPVVFISLFATLVASQAMITGCFSLVSQAINLDLLPPMRIRNTDPTLRGQVFVPFMNWCLGVVTIAFVLGFQTSNNLANAYGMTVLIAFNMTTILLIAYMYYCRLPTWPLWAILGILFPFIFVDVVYLAATLYGKIGNGGWAPLMIAFVLSVTMMCWQHGRRLVSAEHARRRVTRPPHEVSIDALVTQGEQDKTASTCVFLCAKDLDLDTPPDAMTLYVHLTRAAPMVSLLVRIVRRVDVPYEDPEDHVIVERRMGEVGNATIFYVMLRFGYAEHVTPETTSKLVDSVLAAITTTQDDVTLDNISYIMEQNRVDARRTKFNILRRLLVKYYMVMELFAPGECDLFKNNECNMVQLGEFMRV